MAALPRLQRLSAADLDGLLAELKQQGTTKLILLGPSASLAAIPEHWPDGKRSGAISAKQLQPHRGSMAE